MKMAAIFLLSFVTNLLHGQCDCSELLKYGVYNRFSSSDNVHEFGMLMTEVNNSLEQSSSGGTKAGGTYKVFSGNYEKSDAELLKKITNSSSLSETEKSRLKNESASFISSEMMDAYKECLSLCDNSGLNFKANFPADTRFNTINFNVKFNKKQEGDLGPKIIEVNTSPKDCYTCTGDILKVIKSKDRMIHGITYKLNCVRNIKSTPFTLVGTNDLVSAEDALISIHTEFGDYSVRIPPLYFDNGTYNKGMGEIVASMLSEELFVTIHGADWKLADGDEAPTGSSYRKYIDKYLPYMNGKLPNLCGRFLRGLNGERVDQINNEESKKLGEVQGDDFKSHDHNFGNNKAHVGNSSYGQMNNSSGGPQGVIGNLPLPSSGGDETRPRNVTVNFFIKIN